MFWEEDQKTVSFSVPDNVWDVIFKIDCKTLPVDHNQYLSNEIIKVLPWVASEKGVAIQHIHISEESNGWFRPEDSDDAILHISKRTKLSMRIPKDRLSDVEKILGTELDVNGHKLILKSIQNKKKLFPISTISSRFIVTNTEDDVAFIQVCAEQLQAMGITIKKMLSGKVRKVKSNNGVLLTRSLMLADLSKKDSIIVQQNGLGSFQSMGCGIFIPHKGVEDVSQGEANK